METPNLIGSSPQKTFVIPQMGGNVPLAALMQQMTPSLYANGFEISVTGADICMTLSQNNRLLSTINLSFITAKALGSSLSALIRELEEKSQVKVPSVEEVAQALQLHQKP